MPVLRLVPRSLGEEGSFKRRRINVKNDFVHKVTLEKMRYIGNTPRFGKTIRKDLGKVRMYEEKRQQSEVDATDEQQASEEVLPNK